MDYFSTEYLMPFYDVFDMSFNQDGAMFATATDGTGVNALQSNQKAREVSGNSVLPEELKEFMEG